MTKKMPSLFAANPPKRPLSSLDAIIDDWIYRFGAKGDSRHMRDEVVDYCRAARSFREAVTRACNSKRPNGKVHNHQSRVKLNDRELFAEQIYHQMGKANVKNFDILYDELASFAPHGIGPVTIYDVATRIAAYCRIEVESLYLHAGVRVGWCLLHGRRSPNVLRIPRDELHPTLRRLPTDEIEDMLCCYREYLKPWLAEKE